jgi:hypothetical protein
MTIKWATFLHNRFLNPLFYTHHRYFRKKVVIDRFLESRTFGVNVGIGFVFGIVIYIGISNLSPFVVAANSAAGSAAAEGIAIRLNSSQARKNVAELSKKLNGGEKNFEPPHFALERARYTILSRMCVAKDHMAVKQQRLDVQRVAEEISKLKAMKE